MDFSSISFERFFDELVDAIAVEKVVYSAAVQKAVDGKLGAAFIVNFYARHVDSWDVGMKKKMLEAAESIICLIDDEANRAADMTPFKLGHEFLMNLYDKSKISFNLAQNEEQFPWFQNEFQKALIKKHKLLDTQPNFNPGIRIDKKIKSHLAAAPPAPSTSGPSAPPELSEEASPTPDPTVDDKIRAASKARDPNCFDFCAEVANALRNDTVVKSLYSSLVTQGEKDIIRGLVALTTEEQIRVITALKGSFIDYTATQIPRKDFDVVIGKAPELTDRMKVAMRTAPMTNSVLANFSAPQASRKAPVSIDLPDATGCGTGTLITRRGTIAGSHGKLIAQRVYSEVTAFKTALKDLEEYAFSDDDIAHVESNNNFVPKDFDAVPSGPWTRLSTKPKYNQELSTTSYKHVSGMMAYCLKQAKNPKDNGGMVVSVRERNLNCIPTFCVTGSRVSNFLVMRQNKHGRQFIQEAETYSAKVVSPMKLDNFYNYSMVLQKSLLPRPIRTHALHESGINKPPIYVDSYDTIESRFANKLNKLVSTYKDKYASYIQIVANQRGLRRAIQDEMSLGGNHLLLGLFTLINQLPDASYTAVCCHDLLVALQLKVVNSDFVTGQTLSGTFPETKAARVFGVNGFPITGFSLDASYHEAPSDLVDGVAMVYKRGGRLPSGIDGVLVDLTIPGRLFQPQNEQARAEGKAYKGSSFLHDSPTTACLYSVEYLMTLQGFMVYFNISTLMGTTNRADILSYKNLFTMFDVWFAPTAGHNLFGVYMVAARKNNGNSKQFTDAYGKPMSSYNLADYRTHIMAHLGTKMTLFVDLFSYYLNDPMAAFIHSEIFLRMAGGGYLKKLQKDIGSRSAYEYLVRTCRDKVAKAKELNEVVDIESIFGDDVSGAANAEEAAELNQFVLDWNGTPVVSHKVVVPKPLDQS